MKPGFPIFWLQILQELIITVKITIFYLFNIYIAKLNSSFLPGLPTRFLER